MAVKVVLRQDVDHLGERGEIVNVAPGYARNFLLPKGLAYHATPGHLKVLELEKRAWSKRESREADESRALAARIGGLRLVVTKKSGEGDTLYGSVTNAEIADLLAARGIEVDRRQIRIDEPIKTLGTFTVPIRLHRQVTAEVSVEVRPESE
jgi:large subunit ribosomal protein L9